MKRYLDGRRGILLFRNGGAGHHTELWDETHIIQDGKAVSGGGAVMNESSVFGQPRVLLWAVSEEKNGYHTRARLVTVVGGRYSTGNTYYYYFSDQLTGTQPGFLINYTYLARIARARLRSARTSRPSPRTLRKRALHWLLGQLQELAGGRRMHSGWPMALSCH